MKTHATIVAVLLGVAAVGAGEAGTVLEWTLDGERREALVIPPARKTDEAAPAIFVFHGHGGSWKSIEQLDFQKYWPEAIIVCPQGLPTATGRDPEGRRSGWQQTLGTSNDRDLKFMDAILKSLREGHGLDETRVFATGHSNGGGFTYLLSVTRSKVFAAIAPSAAGARGLLASEDARPMPVMHIAGKADNIVPFEKQQQIVELLRKRNGCGDESGPWATSGDLVGTLYPSRNGTPVVSVVHPGTHKYPLNAPELIVRFFKEQSVVKTR